MMEKTGQTTPEYYSLSEIKNGIRLSVHPRNRFWKRFNCKKFSDTNVWESEPIIELVDTILESAMMQRVSDIHFEPFETHLSVRFRKDGLLIPHLTLPDWLKIL